MQKETMINQIKKISNSNLRIFCNTSYSIKLFYILLSNAVNELSIDEIFNNLTLPKPKKSSVDSFIKILIAKDYVKKVQNKDKRKKTLVLTEKSLVEYRNLNL